MSKKYDRAFFEQHEDFIMRQKVFCFQEGQKSLSAGRLLHDLDAVAREFMASLILMRDEGLPEDHPSIALMRKHLGVVLMGRQLLSEVERCLAVDETLARFEKAAKAAVSQEKASVAKPSTKTDTDTLN